MKRVGDLKLRDPIFVPPDATMFQAVHLMHTNRVGALIVSPDEQSVESVITERDIIYGIDRHGIEFMREKVRDRILHAPVTCRVSETVEHAAKIMQDRKIRHIPVVRLDEGREIPVGLIGAIDVLKNLEIKEAFDLNE